jgi:hypothetical protein
LPADSIGAAATKDFGTSLWQLCNQAYPPAQLFERGRMYGFGVRREKTVVCAKNFIRKLIRLLVDKIPYSPPGVQSSFQPTRVHEERIIISPLGGGSDGLAWPYHHYVRV